MPFQAHAITQTWGKFNGNLLDWYDFKARFKLGVHDVADMPASFKIQQLRNALTGEAEEAMKGFTLAGDNYDALWNALVEKYETRFPMACAYLSKFFALKKMSSPTNANELKRLANVTNELIRQLRTMEYPVDGYGLIFVHALQERLNRECAGKWEAVRKGLADKEQPAISDMLKFLDDEATSVANRGLAYSSLQVSVQNEYARHHPTATSHRRPSTGTEPQQYPCPVMYDDVQRTLGNFERKN